jgi:addiction module HigA family antidote
MANRKLRPVHPGEILLPEFLVPLGNSQYRLAKETSVPPGRINEIVKGQRAITADSALRLARYFGTSDQISRSVMTSKSSVIGLATASRYSKGAGHRAEPGIGQLDRLTLHASHFSSSP